MKKNNNSVLKLLTSIAQRLPEWFVWIQKQTVAKFIVNTVGMQLNYMCNLPRELAA